MIKFEKAQMRYDELIQIAHEKGYKPGWIWYQLVKEFGKETAKQVYNTDGA